MEILTVGEVIDRVAEVGGSLQLKGEHVALTLPWNCPPDTEVAIVETVRANRNVVSAVLRDFLAYARHVHLQIPRAFQQAAGIMVETPSLSTVEKAESEIHCVRGG